MHSIKLTKENLISIYSKYGKCHFPADELKPVSSIERLWEAGLYAGLGFYEEDKLVGYALFVILKEQRIALLDYYAFLEEYRNQGFGSIGLETMRRDFTEIDGFYIESENPDFAEDEEHRLLQNRRLSFYGRNGGQEVNLLSTLFGVHYRIFYVATVSEKVTSGTEKEYYKELFAIYQAMFPEKYWEKDIKLEVIT